MSALPQLTPHQYITLRDLIRRGAMSQPAREQGSHGGCWRLVKKGYVEPSETYGPRGGTIYWYRVTEAAQESAAVLKACAEIAEVRRANEERWGRRGSTQA